VGFVDDKMTEIKGNIEELIEESNTLKTKNQEL
jgi:regulator of replication initiation timing